MSHMSQRVAGACSTPSQGRRLRTLLLARHFAGGATGAVGGVVWTGRGATVLCGRGTGGRGRGRPGRHGVGLSSVQVGAVTV